MTFSGLAGSRIIRSGDIWACLIDEFFVVKDRDLFRPATRRRDPMFCAYRFGRGDEGPIGYERAEDAEKAVKALNEVVGE